MTVVSLACARVGRNLKQLIQKEEEAFELAWADIQHEPGIELVASTPIKLGQTVKAQVSKLFAAFGLNGEPITWGQLARNYQYCKQLDSFAAAYRHTNDLTASMRAAEKWWPGWGERVSALAQGNLEKLAALHMEADVFRLNGLRTNDNPYATA